LATSGGQILQWREIPIGASYLRLTLLNFLGVAGLSSFNDIGIYVSVICIYIKCRYILKLLDTY